MASPLHAENLVGLKYHQTCSNKTKSQGMRTKNPARKSPLMVLAMGVMLIVGGCTPQERLAKLLRKYPELRDTVIVEDTAVVVLPAVGRDTVFASAPGDTVVLRQDRLVVRYVRLPGDSAYIGGQCLADTVRVPYRVEVPTVQPSEKIQVVPLWIKIVLAAVSLALLISLFKRR